MAKTTVNPFAAAKRVTAGATTSKAPIYVAQAVVNAKGQELFSRSQVEESIDNYCRGKDIMEQGSGMMKANETVIDVFAQSFWAMDYALSGRQPETPKLSSRSVNGSSMTYTFVDRPINIKDEEIERLKGLVGENQIGSCYTNKEIFSLNPAVLDRIITVKDEKGKPVADTVQNHIAAALQSKFKDDPDLIAELFTVKPTQATAKGLVDRCWELVGNGERNRAAADRIVELVGAAKICTQMKPGSFVSPK